MSAASQARPPNRRASADPGARDGLGRPRFGASQDGDGAAKAGDRAAQAGRGLGEADGRFDLTGADGDEADRGFDPDDRLLDPVFVGREAELAVIDEVCRSFHGGGPRVLWIEGEAGMGKTSLLHRAGLTRPSTTGRPAVMVTADPGEVQLRFGVATQLLALGAPKEPPPPPTADPMAVGARLLHMFDQVQRRPPAVVVVDDMHHCDMASAQALQFALRRLHVAEHVLVVIGARPEAVDLLGDGWRRLRDDTTSTTVVRLGGLAARHVVAMADHLGVGPLPMTVADRLVTHTAGHPLHLRAILEDVPLEVLARPTGPLPVPKGLASVFLTRLHQLEAPARALVMAAAVVGRPLPLVTLGTVAFGRPGSEGPPSLEPERPPTLHRSLDDAVAAGLLQRQADGQVACRHPLVQAAVAGDLSVDQRARLHRRAADVLTGAQRFGHLVAALEAPDHALAEEIRTEAAQRRSVGAFDEAADLLLLVAAATEGSDADDALWEAAEALVAGGDRQRASSLEPQLRLTAASARRDHLLGCCAFIGGQRELARRHLEAAVAAGDDEPRAAALAATVLALAEIGNGNADRAVALGERAQALAGDDPEVAANAVVVLGLALAMVGRLRDAEELLAPWSALAGGPTNGRQPLIAFGPGRLDAVVTAGVVQMAAGRYPAAIATFQQAAAAMRVGAPGTLGVQGLAYLAEAEHQVGRWDDALVDSELAVSVAHDTETVWSYPAVHAICATVHAWRGAGALAEGHAREAHQAAQRYPGWAASLQSAAATATLRLLAGDGAGVLDALEPVHDGPVSGFLEGIGPAPWLVLEADGLVLLGRYGDAAGVLDRLHDVLDRRRHPHRLARGDLDLLRLRALVADGVGDRTTAEGIVARGLALGAQRTDAPLALARLELTAGRLLRSWHQRRPALDALRRADRRLRELGCGPLLADVAEELGRLGVTATEEAAVGADLTAQERVVAHLAATGCTNREIATQLYVSVKAVEYHLGNVYRKLAIRNRGQLRQVWRTDATAAVSSASDR